MNFKLENVKFLLGHMACRIKAVRGQMFLVAGMVMGVCLTTSCAMAQEKQAPATTTSSEKKTAEPPPMPLYEFTKEELEYTRGNAVYISGFQRRAKADVGRIVTDDLVLAIGSSTMAGWSRMAQQLDLNLIQHGFGGSRMVDVLAYKRYFRRYKVKRMLIYEGDNDLAGRDAITPEAFISQCKEFVDYVRELAPETEFYFLSIKPSSSRMKYWPAMSKGNELLKAYAAEDEKIFYIDVATIMLNEEGTDVRPGLLKADRLHMTPEGYALWNTIVKKYLTKE